MSKILRHWLKVKPSLQALKLSPLFGQTLIGSRPYLTLSGFTLLLKLLKFLARLMPLPSLKLRLLQNWPEMPILSSLWRMFPLILTLQIVSFCLSIQSMALFLSLLSFCGWSFFPFFILHKCIECFFGGRLTCLSFTASFPCCPKGLIFDFQLYLWFPGHKSTEAYVTDFCLEKLELGHASLRLDFRYLMFFE